MVKDDLRRFEESMKYVSSISPEECFRDDFAEPLYKMHMETPRWRLEKFCLDVEQNRQISPETLEWLADAGRQYLAGESTLALALGLEELKKRGRPIEKKAGMAGLRMFALKHFGNEKYDVALFQVMKESGLSERTVKRAYAVFANYAAYRGWCQKED